MAEMYEVNSDRLKKDFSLLSKIGENAFGGIDRMAFTFPHQQARNWFRDLIIKDGFVFRVDEAGNHSAIYPCSDPDAKTLLLGSHLDTVPNGGKYDGALGVLAAYEAMRCIRDFDLKLPFHMEVIDFSDEEGTHFGLLGSRALIGALGKDSLRAPRNGTELWKKGLKEAGIDEADFLNAKRDPETLYGFLELHIEQGPRLADKKVDIGVVTSIVGIESLELVFTGRADHAGTTPMNLRKDAGLGAAAFILQARELVVHEFPGCVVNIGQISFSPGAYNIVPASARLAVEYRSASNSQIREIFIKLEMLAKEIASQYGLEFSCKMHGCEKAVACGEFVQQALMNSCRILNLSFDLMHSGAGHDTMSLAQICPSGMIFVPSTGGSHNPSEFASWKDCLNGANVLLNAVIFLAEKY